MPRCVGATKLARTRLWIWLESDATPRLRRASRGVSAIGTWPCDGFPTFTAEPTVSMLGVYETTERAQRLYHLTCPAKYLLGSVFSANLRPSPHCEAPSLKT